MSSSSDFRSKCQSVGSVIEIPRNEDECLGVLCMQPCCECGSSHSGQHLKGCKQTTSQKLQIPTTQDIFNSDITWATLAVFNIYDEHPTVDFSIDPHSSKSQSTIGSGTRWVNRVFVSRGATAKPATVRSNSCRVNRLYLDLKVIVPLIYQYFIVICCTTLCRHGSSSYLSPLFPQPPTPFFPAHTERCSPSSRPYLLRHC